MWKKKQDSDMDQLLKKQRKEIDKLRSHQLIEMKIYRKKLSTDQVAKNIISVKFKIASMLFTGYRSLQIFLP